METSEIIIGKIKGQGLLPLFYHQDPGVCVEVCKALYEAGIRIIEFTNRGESAFPHCTHSCFKPIADILLINLHTSCRHEIHIGKQFFYP